MFFFFKVDTDLTNAYLNVGLSSCSCSSGVYNRVNERSACCKKVYVTEVAHARTGEGISQK